MNPSPTGDINDGRSTPQQVQRYLSRLSGPLLDRIDLQIEVRKPDQYELATSPTGEDSAIEAQALVERAMERQFKRQRKANAELSVAELTEFCKLDEDSFTFLRRAATKLNLSMRVFHRTIKVSRTIADLEEAEHITHRHIADRQWCVRL